MRGDGQGQRATSATYSSSDLRFRGPEVGRCDVSDACVSTIGTRVRRAGRLGYERERVNCAETRVKRGSLEARVTI